MTLFLLLVACGPGRADVAPGSAPLTAPWSTYDLPLFGAEVLRSDASDLDVLYRDDQDATRCTVWADAIGRPRGAPMSTRSRPGGGLIVDWKSEDDVLTTLYCDTADNDIRLNIDIIAAEP